MPGCTSITEPSGRLPLTTALMAAWIVGELPGTVAAADTPVPRPTTVDTAKHQLTARQNMTRSLN